MNKVRFLLLGSLILLTSQCGSTAIRQGEIYKAPGNVFTVPSPVGYGGRYEDDRNSVAFYDDLMGFYRIEHGELSPNDIRSLAEHSRQEQLEMFANQAMLPHIRQAFPHASVLHEEWIEESESFFVVVTLPRGSTYTVNGLRQNVERGMLFFRRGDRMFVLHTQFTPNLLNLNDQKPTSEKVERLKKDLLEFKSSIRFGS